MRCVTLSSTYYIIYHGNITFDLCPFLHKGRLEMIETAAAVSANNELWELNFLGYYATYSGNSLPTLRDKLSGPIFMSQESKKSRKKTVESRELSSDSLLLVHHSTTKRPQV